MVHFRYRLHDAKVVVRFSGVDFSIQRFGFNMSEKTFAEHQRDFLASKPTLPQLLQEFSLRVELYQESARALACVHEAQKTFLLAGRDFRETHEPAHRQWQEAKRSVLSCGEQLARAMADDGHKTKRHLKLLSEIGRDGEKSRWPAGLNLDEWKETKARLLQLALQTEAAGRNGTPQVQGTGTRSDGVRIEQPANHKQHCKRRFDPEMAGNDRAGKDGRDNAEGSVALAEYLAKHADATEDDALQAMNAALPAGAKPWSLDRLRKNKVWREHVERRIGNYMDENPDASLTRIGKNVGYAKSTVSQSQAYQARKEKKKASKPPPKDPQVRNLTEKQLPCLESGKPLPRELKPDALQAVNPPDGNVFVDPNAFRTMLCSVFEDDAGYRQKVNQLTQQDLTGLQQYVKDNCAPDNTELLRSIVEQWLEQWLENRS